MSKLTIKSEVASKVLDPTGDPWKWQRLKVRDHGGRENGETPSLWVPYLGLTPSFSPQSLPAKWREGRKGIGLDELLSV